MTRPALALSQLLITRLCHDIVGPIGAINNGIEFLQDAESGMEKEAITLITDSASQAISRVQFFRYLYGIIKESETVSLQDKKALAESFYQHSRIHLHWQEQHTTDISPEDLRILYNLLYIAGASLIRGGDVTITFHHNAPYVIEATGSHVLLQEELTHILQGDSSVSLNTHNVQVHYTMELIAARKGRLSLTQDAQSLILHYSPASE
jgi:histidine phosphotransferase ChpT